MKFVFAYLLPCLKILLDAPVSSLIILFRREVDCVRKAFAYVCRCNEEDWWGALKHAAQPQLGRNQHQVS